MIDNACLDAMQERYYYQTQAAKNPMYGYLDLEYPPQIFLDKHLITWYPFACDRATDSRLLTMRVQLGDAARSGAVCEMPESVLESRGWACRCKREGKRSSPSSGAGAARSMCG